MEAEKRFGCKSDLQYVWEKREDTIKGAERVKSGKGIDYAECYTSNQNVLEKKTTSMKNRFPA